MGKKIKILSLCILCFCLFSLSGCKSKEPAAPDGWGSLSETDESSGLSGGKEIDVETPESSSSSDDKFSIEGDSEASNIGKSDEEIAELELEQELEAIEAESEPYMFVYDGEERDFRVEAGYVGLLNYVYEYGGVEAVSRVDRETLKERLENIYFLASSDEVDGLLDIIYDGTSEEKQALTDEITHTVEAGWYQDESGIWKNAYEENLWNYDKAPDDANGGIS